jgi:hypothetical protein
MLSSSDKNQLAVLLLTNDFLSVSSGRKLYAITLTPVINHVWKAGLWSRSNPFEPSLGSRLSTREENAKASFLSAREEYVLDLFDLFELSLNRKLCNNWKRRGSKPAYTFGAVEHFEKNSRTFCAPHVHGLLAVEPAFVPAIERHLNLLNGHGRLDLNCLQGAPWESKRHLIDSVVIDPLMTVEDVQRWSGYAFDINKLTFNTTTRGTVSGIPIIPTCGN